jgi:Carboxypeptidase regulatory-like domain
VNGLRVRRGFEAFSGEVEVNTFVKLLVVSALCGGAIYGQAVSQISGIVRDETGAVVPGAQVTATQIETGFKRTAETGAAGNYVLINLPLGPYRLDATKVGFRTYVQTGINLQVGTAPEIQISLGVGQVTESVNVEANASQIETRSIGVGTVIENQRILDLPLNGRQPTDLITLSGASVQTGTSPGYGMRTGAFISVAGSGIEGVQYNLDGAPHINMLDGTGMPLPFPDALQEFKISTSVQDASSSGHSGATVNSVAVSGTNAFHGDAFEFLRNYNANSRDFFASGPDGLKRNQFGGVLGGRIIKDKLFFFLGYQGTTVRQTPISSTANVPTEAMLEGDFTTFVAQCNNGRSLNAPFFVGNMINPASLSRAAVEIAKRLPKPLDACGTTYFGAVVHENDHQAPVRIDYQLNDKQTLFARYLITQQDLAVPYELSKNPLEENVPGFNDRAQSFALGDTYVLSATMVNSFRASVNRVASLKPGASMFGAQDVGIGCPGAALPCTNSNFYTYLPNYLQSIVGGFFTIGGTTKYAFDYQTNFGANNDFSIVRGSHTYAFGGYYTHAANWLQAQAFADGQFQFNGGAAPGATGSNIAEFLLGRVSSLRQQNPNPLNTRQNFFALYVQDTWKINPRLTLNYGLNWAPFFPASFPQGDTYNFSLSNFYAGIHSTAIPNAPAGFTYPGDPGFAGKSGIDSQWKNFDPRIGIAYDPTGSGKTVFRAGAGIGHDFMTANMMINNETAAPFRLISIQTGVNLDDPYAKYSNGSVTGKTPYPFNFDPKNPLFPDFGTYLPVPPNLKTTGQYSWNVGVQRQITPNWFASATYLGTHIVHLWNAVELNPGTLRPGVNNAANLNARRVLNLAGAKLAQVTQYDDGGTQGYNGLLFSTNWRLRDNLTVNANYTWSHCIGLPLITLLNPGANYIHQGFGQNVGEANRNADVGDCLQDRRQVVNLTLVAQTPKFSSRTARLLGSGWSFASTVVARSGAPLTVVTGTNPDPVTGFGGNSPGTQRPNLVLADTASPTQGQSCGTFCVWWLNPGAFAAPAAGTFGNLGQGSIQGPGFWQWDGAISRQFSIREAQKLELRFEGFNVTNSFHPGDPNLSSGTAATFGKIQKDATPPAATTAPARVMQFALKYVF